MPKPKQNVEEEAELPAELPPEEPSESVAEQAPAPAPVSTTPPTVDPRTDLLAEIDDLYDRAQKTYLVSKADSRDLFMRLLDIMKRSLQL